MATITKYEGKKGIRWQVKIRRQGRAQSASFPTKKLAEDWARNLENDLVQHKYFPERTLQTPYTVGELIDEYLDKMIPQLAFTTQKTRRIILKWWKEQLGDTNIANVTPRLIEDYKYVLLKKHKNATVNHYLNCLSPLFTYASSDVKRWIATNPFLKVKRLPEQGRKPVVSDEQLERLLLFADEYGKPYLAIFVRLALATGGRYNEILRLCWKQVNFRQNTITFTDTKNKENRTVPVDHHTMAQLKVYRDEQFRDLLHEQNELFYDRDNLPVFLNRRTGKPLRDIHRSWEKAKNGANLSWLHRHDLRHIFATKMVEKTGADIAVLAELLGHRTLKMVLKYRHIGNAQYAGLVQRMAEQTLPKHW